MSGIHVTLEELLALRKVAFQLNLPQSKSSNHAHGQFNSPFRGRGMDFMETRIYQPGDDIRAINWAVTARTGKPHTKIYQQERDRPIYLIIDFSPTMFFGTRNAFKSVIAAQAAAIIAWAGVKQGDRIGALLLKDRTQFLPPCHRKKTILQLFKHLIDYTMPLDYPLVDHEDAFKQLKQKIKSGSLIYFLSDFYHVDTALTQVLSQLARNNNVTNILVFDPLEQAPPALPGRYLFRNNNSAESLLLDTKVASIRTQYQAMFNQRLIALQKLCFATGMHLVQLATNDDIPKVLRQTLIWKKSG